MVPYKSNHYRITYTTAAILASSVYIPEKVTKLEKQLSAQKGNNECIMKIDSVTYNILKYYYQFSSRCNIQIKQVTYIFVYNKILSNCKYY